MIQGLSSSAKPRSSINSRLIVSARFFSDFGTFLNMVALSTYVYLLSQSVMQVSVFLACRVMGGILASLIGVPFFRRFRGRFSLVVFDILRASLLLPLLILPSDVQQYLLPLIALGIGLGSSMFSIGLNSQLPWWVAEPDRIPTNAMLTSLSATGAVAGSLLAGVLLAASGYEAVFLINILAYLLAGLCVLPLRFLLEPSPSTVEGSRREWRNLRSGLRSAPVLAGMLLVTIADTLGSAAHNVGFPILSELITPDSAGRTMGLLLATWAAGKFAGARIADAVLRCDPALRIEWLFFIGVAVMSLGFIGTFQQAAIALALVFVVLAGVGDGLSDVSLITRIQREPEHLRLPVFSLMTLLQQTGFGIGMLIVAPFYIWFVPSVVIVIFHGLPLLTLTGVAWVNRHQR